MRFCRGEASDEAEGVLGFVEGESWDFDEGGLVSVGAREGVGDGEALGLELGLLMLREREAGGPTGTMREPNSTPMVTSW